MFLGQPRHCICINASRGLALTAEFLVVVFFRFFVAILIITIF